VLPVLLSIASFLVPACMYRPLTNEELFGQTAGNRGPGLFLRAPNGLEASATGNMGLEIHGEGDKTTGKFKIDTILNSNVSEPLKEYPAWINAMAPAQQMNFQATVLLEQELTKQYAGANEVIKSLGADAVKMIPTLFPNGIGSGLKSGGGILETAKSALDTWNSLPPNVQAMILDSVKGIPNAPTPPPAQ